MLHTKTLKVRVRDKHAPLLWQMARSVNFVWNYLNELRAANKTLLNLSLAIVHDRGMRHRKELTAALRCGSACMT